MHHNGVHYTTGFFVVGLSFLLIVLAWPADAEEYTSSNFILRDPVITVEGGNSVSSTFEYFSSTGQVIGGESTSTSFIHRAGFLYFPIGTSPVLTATAGSGQVVLTWTASVATLANITNYQVGIATVSGGPYTYENAGDVLTFTKTGLSNGTTYYFQLKADAGVLTLAKSNEASAAPTGAGHGGAGSTPPPAPPTPGAPPPVVTPPVPPGFPPLPPGIEKCPLGDLNGDGKVNMIDLSILLFWWGRVDGCPDQNGDGIVNMVDLSILLYWWTEIR